MKSKKSDFIITLVMLGLGAFMFVFGLTTNTPTKYLGLALLLGGVVYGSLDRQQINEEKLSSYDYKTHGDFKKYYDTTQKRNIWVLGYFGGGSINISEASKLAKEYAREYNISYEDVMIDEIFRSRRYKHFKFMYSTLINQKPDKDADCYENVHEMLSD